MTPLASVVIPAHDAAAYLRRAVASAQAQTVREVEILVVDDGSTDATWEVAAALAAADPRVVPVRRPRRGGVSAARNEGLARARGRWVAPLDADDAFLPDRVAHLVALGEERGADLVADNLLEMDLDTDAILGPHFPEGQLEAVEQPLALATMLALDMPDLPGRARLGYLQPVARAAFLRRAGVRYAEGVSAGEDFLFYFECVARGARFHLAPGAAGYVYRRRPGSASGLASSAPHYSEANRRMLALAARLGEPGLAGTLRRRQRMLDYSAFVWALEARRPLQALRHARCGDTASLATHLRALRDAVLGGRRTGSTVSRPQRQGQHWWGLKSGGR